LRTAVDANRAAGIAGADAFADEYTPVSGRTHFFAWRAAETTRRGWLAWP